MSPQPLSIDDRLDERARLKALGVQDEEEIAAEIDAALQLRKDHKRLRAILFEVIDDGVGKEKMPYALWHPFDSVADQARTDFVNAVIAKLRLRR